MNSEIRLTASSLLFISGTAALIFQTLWIKQLGLVTGVDVYAVTTGISAFFAGLALGGAHFGRVADNNKYPYRLFAILEICIGFMGVIATLLFFKAPQAFALIHDKFGITSWLIPFLLVGIPAFFMGGSLPVILRCIHPAQEKIGHTSGFFYASNTAGAILGTLLVPFILIPNLGLTLTAIVAAMLNLTVAFLALSLNRRSETALIIESPKAEPGNKAKIALWLYAIAGGVALGYEVVWSQAIAPLLSSRVYAFAIMLAVYLLGLVSGSALFALTADKVKKPWQTFGLLIISAGFSAIFIFTILDSWIIDIQDYIGKAAFSWLKSNMVANVARFSSTALIILFIPTFFLGAAFPVAIRIIAKEKNIGRDVGLTAAYNTAGGIIGSVLTGFVLIPVIGVMKTLSLLAVIASLIGFYPMIIESKSRKKGYFIGIGSILLISLIGFTLPSDKIASLLTERRGGSTIFYTEKAGGSVAVVEQKTPGGDFRRLYIHGVSNSGNSMPSLRYMRLQALLPLLIHNGEPKSSLVIGFGTGITMGSLLTYPGLENRVCAELMPGVLEAAVYFKENLDVLHDKRVDIRIRDGRHELLANEQSYDMITLEPPPPTAAGVVNLYSREFYELAKKRLNKQGLLAQWWPLSAQNEEESKSLIRSFLDVFPYVTLWTTELHETLLIGSNDSITLNFKKINGRFNTESIMENLHPVGILSAEELLATYITDKQGLLSYAGEAKPVTDNYPRIEYAPWTRKGEFPKVLNELSRMASEIPVIETDPITADLIESKRQKLWTLYRAGYYLYLGDEENWENMLKRLIPEIKANVYFRSFIPER